MTIEEMIERHKIGPDTPPPSGKLRMAKTERPVASNWKRDPFEKNTGSTPSPDLLRSKHYRPRPSNLPATRTRTPWLQPADKSGIDKPLAAGIGEPASTKFTDQVRAAAAEVLAHGVALGGDSQRDGERWLSEYLDAHSELIADFLGEIYARAIRAIVQEVEGS